MGTSSTYSDLQVWLLGTLSVTRGDGVTIPIPSRPQRRLLTMLALHAGDTVRSSVLEDQAGLSPGALRTSISRLRRVVGGDALETTAFGYRLRAEVDHDAFERMVGLAPELADAEARIALSDAVALWRGDPLVEFEGETWTDAPLRHLAERHASAMEDLALLHLEAGDIATALATARTVVEREPFRERPRALLIRALAEDGRPTEALRAFQSYRALLGDEIGIEPSAALVELDRAIARSVDTSSPTGPEWTDAGWGRERRTVPRTSESRHHLPPVPVSSFVGRSGDVATVLGLVAVERLVTLTGAGGCGKTRLAIAVASADADLLGRRPRWVELGVVSASSHVVEHVAAAVGLTLRPDVDVVEQLVDHLVDAPPTLLVLDNAEHVIAPVEQLLTALLERYPSLRTLVTSREPLGVPGERVWRVPSLSTPAPGAPADLEVLMSYDSARLFLERARSARPDLATDQDTLAHVASICIGVDGLPLALELAAARTRTHPVEVVAAGINDAVRWQSGLHRAPLARHATLHASIQWSVDLVEPLARTVLGRLSVFQTSFSFDAALAVGRADEPGDLVSDAIAALVDANLLQFEGPADRLRMLNTVRRFCTLRAQGSELEGARERHARYCASYCEEIGEGVHGIERGPFIREMPNLVAAMEWARQHEPRLMFRMCTGLASVRTVLGFHDNIAETWTWLLSLDRGPQCGEAWRREWAAAVAAQMATATAHRIDVGSVADEVLSMLPADAGRARGWAGRGAAMRPAYQGHPGPILAYADEVRARHDDLEYSVYGGFAAYMAAMMGRLEEADHHVHELQRLSRRYATSFSVDTVGNGFAAVVVTDLIRGDVTTAAGRAHGAVPDDPSFSMTAAAALAQVALVSGDRNVLAHAIEWSRQPTIPLLRFLPTFIELVKRRLGGHVEHAADLAEQVWEEAEHLPVSRVYPLPILTAALVDAGRIGVGRDMTERAALIVAGMDPAPLLSAGVLESRAMLDLASGEILTAAGWLRDLLEISVANQFGQMTIDALERVAEAAGDGALAATLRAPTQRGATLTEAVRLGQRWLTGVASG